MLREIDLHSPNHKQVNSTAKKHLKICAKEPEDEPVTEQEQVQRELEHFNTRWSRLTGSVKELMQQLNNVEKEVIKMTDKERVLEDLFQEVEKTLEQQKPVSSNPVKCKEEHDRIKV